MTRPSGGSLDPAGGPARESGSGGTLNKNELVSEVAKRTDLAKSAVARVVDEAIAAIKESVAKGQRVSLSGFGTFERRRRAARLGRNPHTGEAVRVAATNAPTFRPGAAFKDAVVGKRGKRAPKRAAARRGARRRSVSRT